MRSNVLSSRNAISILGSVIALLGLVVTTAPNQLAAPWPMDPTEQFGRASTVPAKMVGLA